MQQKSQLSAGFIAACLSFFLQPIASSYSRAAAKWHVKIIPVETGSLTQRILPWFISESVSDDLSTKRSHHQSLVTNDVPPVSHSYQPLICLFRASQYARPRLYPAQNTQKRRYQHYRFADSAHTQDNLV